MVNRSSEEKNEHLSANATETRNPIPLNSGSSEKGGEIEQIENWTLLKTLTQPRPEGSFIPVCTKSGNPTKGGWPAQKATEDLNLMLSNNNYGNISTFYPDQDGSLNVKKENFAALGAVVLDDVGTKIPWSRLGESTPTWAVETSPGNYQVGFKLTESLTDIKVAESLVKSVINAGVSDEGMNGVSRWFRLPQGINGKPEYIVDAMPFQCRLALWNPDQTYSLDELIGVLGLSFENPEMSKSDVPALDDNPSAADPVLTALKENGLYKKEISPRKHDITCPWCDEHTDEIDNGTAYFEPSPDFPDGGLKCHHSHGEDLSIHDLRRYLGLEKPVIQIVPGKMDETIKTASRILAEDSSIFYFGNLLGCVQTAVSGEIEFAPFNNSELTLLLAQKMDWQKYNRERGWESVDPPERYVRILYDGSSSSGVIPELKGIVRQPYFRESDGQLVTKPSYDPISNLYGAFYPEEFKRLEPTRENAEKSLALLRGLLPEFKFVRCKDDSVPLVAFLTAAIRPFLDRAPGFHAHASTYGSGKSYFCELTGLFASAAPTEKVSYPKDDEDATKKILSLLMKSPACIEFDDMSTNWKPFTILKQMFTSEKVSDRLLGVNKTITVSTRSLILGSGNNVEPERDMRRRVMTMYIDPQVEIPANTSYEGDPVEEVKKHRGRYVMAAMNIIESWMAAGMPKSELQNIASYDGDWTTYCRQPLAWLGVGDPVVSLVEQVAQDPDREALNALFEAWYAIYRDSPVTTRKLLSDCQPFHGSLVQDPESKAQCPYTRLMEALEDLPVYDRGRISPNKLGWFFKQNVNKIVSGYKLVKTWADGRRAWKVVKVD